MNLVITISRRFGTGASLIAQELSEKLGVPVYDKAYIEHELDGDSYATEAEVIKGLAEHTKRGWPRYSVRMLRSMLRIRREG